MIEDRPKIVHIEKVVNETPTIRTLYFRDEACSRAEPGQFIMIWIPSVNEVPMSLSVPSFDDSCSVTVRRVGVSSTTLYSMKLRDVIGVRGPYGSSFKPVEGRVLMVGGGTGIAPLAFMFSKYEERFSQTTVIVGAKTRAELLFLEKFEGFLKKGGDTLIVTTDDGSFGLKGRASEAAETLLRREKFDCIYTCGPELMVKKIFLLAEDYGMPVQAGLERPMKCGFGICGSCCICGYLVCKDGPVFDSKQLRAVKDELGVFRRNHSGRRISFEADA